MAGWPGHGPQCFRLLTNNTTHCKNLEKLQKAMERSGKVPDGSRWTQWASRLKRLLLTLSVSVLDQVVIYWVSSSVSRHFPCVASSHWLLEPSVCNNHLSSLAKFDQPFSSVIAFAQTKFSHLFISSCFTYNCIPVAHDNKVIISFSSSINSFVCSLMSSTSLSQ